MQKLCLIAALAFLYLTNLGRVGFIGPDEPRYASIGREMARSGDWITPRLDGMPWYEKPPLLYWTTGLATRLGLHDEWAARLPVALIGLGFLLFFYRVLEREYSDRVALSATAILGTSAGWASLSFAAVTDMPMAAALNTAMLTALFGPQALGARGTGGREGRYKAQGYVAGFFLGLAVLAKGFVPLVLIAPVFLVARGKRLRMIAACVAIAVPWYLLCYQANGAAFWDEFFWKHHFARFMNGSLEHVQPFWFPSLAFLGAIFPWTPLVALIPSRRALDDARVRFLLVFLLFGLVFFSASTNKLATYILPLLPAIAIVTAVALEKAKAASRWLAACALVLVVIPTVADFLPDALNSGLSSVQWRTVFGWMLLVPLSAAVGTWWLAKEDPGQEWSERRRWASLVVAIAAVFCVGYLKWAAFPVLENQVSPRSFWQAHRQPISQACAEYKIKRGALYGLNYYAERSIPICSSDALPRIEQIGNSLRIVE